MSLPDRIDGPLEEWVLRQRWFASKAREVAAVNVLERVALSEDPALSLELVEARFHAGTHELYQLLPGDGEAAVRVLARLLGEEATVGGVAFHGGLEPTGEIRAMGAEQSNSSMVFGEQQVLKVFRRVEPGINPELEMLRFLSARGFAAVAKLTGWYDISGELMQATLGIMQEFVPDARDGWEMALDDPLGVLARLPELGAATGQMHSVLASDPTVSAFAPEEPSAEALSLLTATIDEQIEQVFLDLRPGTPALEPIRGRGEEVRDRLQLMSHVGVGGRLIRHHGDYHLGQTMLRQPDPGESGSGGGRSGWTILDFEGEPARSLLDRRRKRSPLRDVAGMLRSFAYAASASELLRGKPAPPGWEEQAREGFLEAYLETVDQSLLPAGRPATDKLLAIFELEKAVYELRYELNNRLDWVPIPVAGIARLLQEGVPT
jgi:maltokinase